MRPNQPVAKAGNRLIVGPVRPGKTWLLLAGAMA
jgi:hypothetical protein